MALWKDATGALYDDDDGRALELARWPEGLTLLTDAEVAAVHAANAWAIYQISATTAYGESTDIVMRCYEAAIAVPPAWVAYRKYLRAIIDATAVGDPTQPLPTRPDSPSGI